MLEKLQKRICWTVSPSLAASLEPLAHRGNVASLSLLYRYYFDRCSSELTQLVPPPFSRRRSTRCSDRLDDISVTIPRCSKDVYVSSFFPPTARLWNSVSIELFPLTYNLNGLIHFRMKMTCLFSLAWSGYLLFIRFIILASVNHLLFQS